MNGRPPSSAAAPHGCAVQRLARLQALPRRPGAARLFFHDPHFGNAVVKLLPGEHFVHDEDVVLLTTLGSCIAVCLWDRERRVGGMNHFMLPDGPQAPADDADAGRYGACAMQRLIAELAARGASHATLEAKVFGGGAVVGGMTQLNVGERNTRFALDFLAAQRIAVVAHDVLDVAARRVCFLPASGRAWVKRLPATHGDALAAQGRGPATAPSAAGGEMQGS